MVRRTTSNIWTEEERNDSDHDNCLLTIITIFTSFLFFFFQSGPSLIDDPSIWQHFSGNFFMTRCQHVRQLNPPYTSKILDEIHDIQKASKNDKVSGYPHAYPPYGRYAAEYWVMNDAGERPEHDKHASEWPNLHNNHTQYRPPVINSKQICFRHVPHSVVSGEDKVQTLLNWDSSLYDEETN